MGGGVRADLEYADGVTGGAVLRLASSTLRSYEGGGVVIDGPRTSGLGAFGVYVGYDRRYIGGSLGLASVALLDFDDALVLPFGQVRVGQLEQVWGEATVGSVDPLFYTNLVGAGLGARVGASVLLRGGLTVFAKPLRDGLAEPDLLTGGTLVLGGDAEDNVGVYVDVRVLTGGTGWGLDLGALLGSQPSVRLGLGYAFDGP
jgi:hypothetical protein